MEGDGYGISEKKISALASRDTQDKPFTYSNPGTREQVHNFIATPIASTFIRN
jgi:hypothetical protein